MGDYNLSLEIKTVGANTALAALDDLDRKGRAIVEDVSGATGRAMGDVAASYVNGSRQVRMALEDIAIGHRENIAEMEREEAAALRSSATSVAGLGRVRQGLVSLVARATETVPVLDRIGASLLTMTAGGAVTLGVVAGIAAIAEAYRFLTRDARETADAQEKALEALKKWKAERDAGVGGQFAVNVGTATAARDAALAALTTQQQRAAAFAAGSEGRKIADSLLPALQKAYDDAAALVTAGEAHLGELRKKAADDGVSAMARNMAALIEANDATPGLRANGERMVTEWTKQAKALAAVGSSEAMEAAARLIGDADLLQKALHPADSAKWFAEQERQIKGLSLAGELSATRIGQLKDEAAQWRAMAASLGVANPLYEKYLALAKADDDLIQKNKDLSYSGSRAASAFAKGFGSPAVVSPGEAARQQLVTELAGDPKAFKNDKFDLDLLIAQQIANDPFLKFQKAVKDLAKRMHAELTQVVGDGLAAGFEAAFTGKGITGAFEALTSTVLGGLGSFMIQLGTQMLVVGVALDALSSALLSLNGPGAIAAGVGLIAAGAGLKAIAGSFGHSTSSGSGGGTSAGYYTPSFLSFGAQAQATPTTSLGAAAVRTSFGPNYFIGPDDPKVVRQLSDVVNRGADRGLIPRMG